MEQPDGDVPQWKKDLIARLRNQNRAQSPLSSSRGAGQQPDPSRSAPAPVPSGPPSGSEQCDAIVRSAKVNMVQERVFADEPNSNGYSKDTDSDSSEDLHYGPGIVNKLKNKYLSLALRESSARPSILHLRKATSLENLLDDEAPLRSSEKRYSSRKDCKNVPMRYRNGARGEMKRARSVETISRYHQDNQVHLQTNNRQSLHEEILSVDGEANDYQFRKPTDNSLDIKELSNGDKFSGRVNRPKRIQPLMSEKEKPQADFVKQAKMIFERRPEQRTRKPPQTGDVAAKVDSFNSIIVKAKVEAIVTSKKPAVNKHTKPVLNDQKPKRQPAKSVQAKEEPVKPKTLNLKCQQAADASLSSPIPDVSRIDFQKTDVDRGKIQSNLSETPDLILTSSPLPTLSSPVYKKTSTENFLKEEIRNASPTLDSLIISPILSPTKILSPTLSPSISKGLRSPSPKDENDFRIVSPTAISNIGKQASGSSIFNFTNQKVNQDHLPVNRNVSEDKVPTCEPLKIEVNGVAEAKPSSNASSSESLRQQVQVHRNPPKFLPPPPPKALEKKQEPAKGLTVLEIEKNLINTVKTLSQPGKSGVSVSVEVVNKSLVASKKPGRSRQDPSTTTAIFNFTNRKDVPDYISNDRSRSPGRPELPKPGEGGIILIPGATINDSFTDEDEELVRSLEGRPPSPCDVTFINDNVLIEGKSSLRERTKRTKLRISFVDEGPEIYEYPSETSMLLDDSPISPVQMGHTVPMLGGSTLANYTPKSTEDFKPGVTRSFQQNIPAKPDVTDANSGSGQLIEEIDQPFSSGTNSDMLF